MMFDYLDKKLILVSAPAGYGKTSLLIDLCHHNDLPFCWLSLDSLDRDPQRFATYFIEAIAEHFPNFGKQTKSALDTLTTIDKGIEQLVTTLVNEIYAQIPQHFVLVLDDFHLIRDVTVIQDFLGRFLQLVDENCHLVISSRALTQIPDLPLMVARDMVGGLDLSELAFRVDELQALLAQNYNMQISDDTARELVQDTEGWITGLQLSSLGMAQGMTDRLRVARAAGVGLFDYLGQQVLDQQPDEIRFFLLRSSLLEEFDATLCEEVLGNLYPERKDWRQWVDYVIQRNLFALPVGMESGWVRYHHLFRDFLQERLYREHSDEIPAILRSLAKVYETHSEWEKAYHVQKLLGDVNAIAGLIERAAPHLMSHALVTLDTWIKDLPPSILSTRPGILSIRGGILHVQGDSIEGLKLLDRANSILQNTENITGLAINLVRRATVHRFLGNYVVALRDADEALRLTEASDQMQPIYANALRQKGLSLYRQGNSRQAVKMLEHALGVYKRIEDNSHIPILIMETGVVYDATGKKEEAKHHYDDALKIWKKEGNLTWQASLLNNLGVLYYSQGEYSKAILMLEEGLLCAKQSGYYARMEALILISMGDVYVEVGDFNLAQQHYQKGGEIAEEIEDRFLLNYLSLARTNLSLWQQEFDKATRLLNHAKRLISSGASQYEEGFYEMLRGQLLLHQKKVKQAKEALEIAEAHFKADGRNIEYAKSQILLASAYSQEQDDDNARSKLKELLESYNNTEYPVVAFYRQAEEWLGEFQKDAEIGRALRDLFNKSHQIYKKMPAVRRQIRRLARTMDIPDAKLIIRGFGRTQVKVGGKSLALSDWQTQSVHDLFFYFLTMKEPLTKEQIGTIFWPDIEEPSRLKMRFKNDIYRLRRAIGSDAILFENDRYSFNRSCDYEYDVEAFESLLFQTKVTRDTDLQIELLERAVNLVHGHFLEDIYATWAWTERERISQIFLQTLLDLAELLKNTNKFQEALGIYQRAIDHDPTFEIAYLHAMNLYMQLNDRVSAIRLSEAYTDMMAQELDLPPSSEMEAVYKRLAR